MSDSELGELPNNLFYLEGETVKFTDFIISSRADKDTIKEMRKSNIDNQKIYQSQIFNTNKKYYSVSYLPYFMNCEGVGNYIFI